MKTSPREATLRKERADVPMIEEEEAVQVLVYEVVAECGLCDVVCVVWYDERRTRVVGVDVYHHADITFDVLDRLSKALGTRDINLSCDLGCESDRSHAPPCVSVRGVSRDLVGEARRRIGAGPREAA
jgi:hypothetical protein